MLRTQTPAPGSPWIKEEFILAFNLYLKLPFGQIRSTHPEIIKLANIMGRSANSVALRLTNFAACDPFHRNRGVVGMQAGKKQCQPIWDEFNANREALVFESERILAEWQNQTIETKFKDILTDIKDLKGKEKTQEIKTRVNQNVFRQLVLGNYNQKCALTGIDLPELLVASHIIPWAMNEEERLNPENGICLSALYDKAFDQGLLGFTKNYRVVLSSKILENETKDYYQKYFAPINHQTLIMPQRYLPNPLFLEWHMDKIFQR